MTEYREYTPERRVYELAMRGSGRTAEEVLEQEPELTEEQEQFLGGFTTSYAQGMLFANTRDGSEPDAEVAPEDWQTPADGWQVRAFTERSQQMIREDCEAFVRANWTDLQDLDASQSGQDFALSRNGHGAGFFDRGLGDKGTRLQEAAKVYGESTAWFDAEHPDVQLTDEPVEFEDPESDPAVADYLDSLERDSIDGPNFYEADYEIGA